MARYKTKAGVNPLTSPAWYPSNIDPNYLRRLTGISYALTELRKAFSQNTQDYHAMMQQRGNAAHTSSWWQQCKANYCRRHLAIWKGAGRYEPTIRQRNLVQKNANKSMQQRAEEMSKRFSESRREQIHSIMEIVEENLRHEESDDIV